MRLTVAVWFLLGFGLVFAQSDAFDWQELGASTYNNCAGCHQADGAGIDGVFPALAGHLPNVIAKDGGRTYLMNVLLAGLTGEIEVLGARYDGAMPSWASLSDEQIAAVLNHELNAWGNAEALPEGFTPILPADVAAERAKSLTTEDVLALRAALGLSGDE